MALLRQLISYSFFSLLCFVPVAQAQNLPSQDTGRFDVKVPVGRIVDIESLGSFADIYHADDEISWHIYVPEDYDPNNPPGVFVFISPSKSGKAQASWYNALKRENFIYISANKAGNLVPGKRRISNAALAVAYIDAHYEINDARTVIAGFSGGGRISSLVVESVPGVFNAGIFMGGAFEWGGDPDTIKEQLGGGAYVFMTGEFDQAQGEVQKTYRQYKKQGLKHLKLVNGRKTGHEYPKRGAFASALKFISKNLQPDNQAD